MIENPNTAIAVAFSGGRWIAWTIGDPDTWTDYYPLCMTRSEVERAARRDFIAECC